MYQMKSPKKLKTLLVAVLIIISNWHNRSSSHWFSRMEMELQGAEETQDFVDGSSGPNLQMMQHFMLPLALERWRCIYIVSKKLKTSLVDPLVLISNLCNRSSSHWLSRMEMEPHFAKETWDFVGGSSGPNLPITQQVKLPLALEDGNGATLHRRN